VVRAATLGSRSFGPRPVDMGRFTCVCCQSNYFERRFVWEAEDAPDGEVGDDSRGEEVAPAADECGSSSSGSEPFTASLQVHATLSSLRLSNEKAEQESFRVYADATRASGTTANILGSVAPWLHSPLSPVSALAGAIGAVSGAVQLHQGLSSEVIDPHLVTKGGVTTGVGSVCMALGLASAAFPVLFPVSLAIGAVGLGVASGVDASMSGLCPACRDAPPRVEAEAWQDSGSPTVEQVEQPETVYTTESMLNFDIFPSLISAWQANSEPQPTVLA